MDLILIQITRGLERGFHYLAVVTALTLPDICGALESEDGWATKPRFVAWWEQWMAPRYPLMTAEDAYALRSGIVHQAKLAKVKPDLTYDRIVFTVVGRDHNNIRSITVAPRNLRCS